MCKTEGSVAAEMCFLMSKVEQGQVYLDDYVRRKALARERILRLEKEGEAAKKAIFGLRETEEEIKKKIVEYQFEMNEIHLVELTLEKMVERGGEMKRKGEEELEGLMEMKEEFEQRFHESVQSLNMGNAQLCDGMKESMAQKLENESISFSRDLEAVDEKLSESNEQAKALRDELSVILSSINTLESQLDTELRNQVMEIRSEKHMLDKMIAQNSDTMSSLQESTSNIPKLEEELGLLREDISRQESALYELSVVSPESDIEEMKQLIKSKKEEMKELQQVGTEEQASFKQKSESLKSDLSKLYEELGYLKNSFSTLQEELVHQKNSKIENIQALGQELRKLDSILKAKRSEQESGLSELENKKKKLLKQNASLQVRLEVKTKEGKKPEKKQRVQSSRSGARRSERSASRRKSTSRSVKGKKAGKVDLFEDIFNL